MEDQVIINLLKLAVKHYSFTTSNDSELYSIIRSIDNFLYDNNHYTIRELALSAKENK